MTDFGFTPDDLTDMCSTQVEHMLDQCVLITYTQGERNEFNEDDAPVEKFSDPLPCGLDMRAGSERHGLDMTVIQYDATLRLPLQTPLLETQKIQIIARFGQFITPLTFECASPPQSGPSGLRVLLRKVVT